MPFSIDEFKAVCHSRGMTPAILATDVEPLAATLVTEHCAAFPKNNSPECFVSVFVGANGRTFEAIKYARFFGLSILNEEQVDIANGIYAGEIAEFEWRRIHNVPYLANTNAIICSLDQHFECGPNQLVVGHVMRVIQSAKNKPPLLNYNKSYCRLDGTRIPVANAAIPNERLD